MTAAHTPPTRSFVIARLREGLGTEDIAVEAGATADQVRAVVNELRREGIIENIRFDRPRAAA